ncbi:branched-chain amino acid transport system II carrier protein [Staphylococcus aureus]
MLATFTKKHVPKFSYKIFALIFSIIGFLFTTLGLEMILKIAVPLLTLIYPCRLHLYSYHLLTCLSKFRFSWAYRLATVITLIISILQILNSFNLLHGVIFEMVYDVTFSRYRFSFGLYHSCSLLLSVSSSM